MCGIIGYAGQRPAREQLLTGLARLEHRGYDSAGLCTLGDDGLELVRAVGHIANLRRRVNGYGATATAGIAHTRWATHGRVSECNAHPLVAGGVAIALNGIVENHRELRAELAGPFSSDTDAEVVAHLVSRAYRGDLAAAVRAAYTQLDGHFAFVAVHRDTPGTIVGARRECPLLAGMGRGETFLASSPTAFETRSVTLIEDGEIAVATAAGVWLHTAAGRRCQRAPIVIAHGGGRLSRGGHESFMLKEIHEQPAAVRATLAAHEELDLDLAWVQRVVVVGCGSALHAGLLGRHAFETWADLPCETAIASEWRHSRPRLPEGTLVLAISQSGETADTLAAVRMARRRGARTLAITNSPGSQLTREADLVLFTRAGVEVGVAATKTFTTQVALLYRLALHMAGEPPRALDVLPGLLAAALRERGPIDSLVRRHAAAPYFVFLGRDAGLPVCLEGALKLKEIAYVPAEAHAAGEMKHGPIALLAPGTPVVCVATRSHVHRKLLSNLEEVRARGALVYAVAAGDDESVRTLAAGVLPLPPAPPLLAELVATVPLQLLAHRVAQARGLDVDRPRNLAKTVTVE